MPKPIVEGRRDGADEDATGTADAANANANANVDAGADTDADHSDEYDLFDRNNLYAKAEKSYKHEWKKPSSHKLSLQEVDVDKIRGFDSNDDSQDDGYHPGDNRKGHPPPDRCCIPADLDLSAMLLKERRMKKILLLVCFLLSVTCISLLFDPQSRILSSRGAGTPYSSTNYMRTDSDHDSEREEHDLKDNSYEEVPPLDTAQNNEAFGAAQEFVQEIGGGNYPEESQGFVQGTGVSYPLEPSDTEAEDGGETENNPQDLMEQQQQQPQQRPPEENTEQDPWFEPDKHGGVGEDIFLDNSDSTQDGSGQEALQLDSQGMFGNDDINVANDAISSPDNNDSNLDFVEEQNEETTAITEEALISPLQMATRFRSLDTYNRGEQLNGDLPLFWYIPKSGSNIVEDIMMECFSLVGVTNKSGSNKDENDAESLTTYKGGDERTYVNVDISSPEGLQNAIERDFVKSNLADVVMSPLINDVSKIFDDKQQQQLGRCFTLFRNPIDRAVSIYYYLQSTSEEWKGIKIDDYAKSIDCESNWMVRELTGKLYGGILTPGDTNQAKAFIRDYCVIGLQEEMENSIRQFQGMFGWQNEAEGCIEHTLQNGVMDTSNYEKFDEHSMIWEMFYAKNQEDWELYRYAVQLFNERASVGL